VSLLTDWTKFYEAITKPLPIAVSIFLLGATSFLLGASNSVLSKLGLSQAVIEYRWAVGLGFLIAATWIIVTAIIWICKRGEQAWSSSRAEKKQQRRLHDCTADERRILSGYVENEVRSQIFHTAPDLGAAQGLADDGILYRPGVMRDGVAVTYNIQEWALAYLSKNSGLVSQVVLAQTRWSEAGQNRELLKKKPKWMTILGGLILLLSWGTENTLYHFWNSRDSELKQAEMIYYTFLSGTFTINAIQEHGGSALWGTESFRLGLDRIIRGLPKPEQTTWLDSLSSIPEDKLNDFGVSIMKEVESQQNRIESWERLSRWSFLLAYVIGSALLILAELTKSV
jgi:hypothetical protein